MLVACHVMSVLFCLVCWLSENCLGRANQNCLSKMKKVGSIFNLSHSACCTSIGMVPSANFSPNLCTTSTILLSATNFSPELSKGIFLQNSRIVTPLIIHNSVFYNIHTATSCLVEPTVKETLITLPVEPIRVVDLLIIVSEVKEFCICQSITHSDRFSHLLHAFLLACNRLKHQWELLLLE